jgi:hypothetical protein
VSSPKTPAGLDSHHAARVLAKASSSRTSWRQELSGTIAQRLDLEQEIHHKGSKLCILGFELLN